MLNSDYLVKTKNPSNSFSVTVPVTKSFLSAIKWTYLAHHSLRHLRKSSEENCEKLSWKELLCCRLNIPHWF